MRIISGKRRGYKLDSPPGDGTRPTTDRVKESLFNIIQMRFPCRLVLDLFAGSGALGIEALSRGADCAVFVENSRKSADLVNNNLNGSGFQEFSVLYQTDAIDFLDKLFDGDVMVTLDGKNIPFKLTHGFDIIFLDPPYNKGLLIKALDKIYEYNLLSDDGIIVAETETGGEDITCTGFDIIKSSRYGKTVITVMQR